MLIGVALVASVFALAGWIFAVPLGVLGVAAVWGARIYQRERGADDVNWMREQANRAGPLDKGGVEFTDRDRETLSS